MPTDSNSITVNDAFFEPLRGRVQSSPHTLSCREYSDESFVRLGVERVLQKCESGRAFLQERGWHCDKAPGHSNYFAALHSSRRRDVLRDVNMGLIAETGQMSDRLAAIPELNNYVCFALDGHWHKAAVHDARSNGVKFAVGHFYSLNLHTHALRHMATAQGLHEHDMSALKRIKPKGLKHGIKPGKRVLLVYDKAGIDFAFWNRCRRESAVYFVSRVKENMVFKPVEEREWDESDPRNHGVIRDRTVTSPQGHLLRVVNYLDPLSGRRFEFLTNEPDLPPGVIVELYRRRWEVEKVFDEIKNKLGEKKAWATSLVAKESQAQLIAITHNLLLMYENALEERHSIRNEAEDRRRTQRAEVAHQECETMGTPVSALLLEPRRASQRSVKFVRWIRSAIRAQLAEARAVPRLRLLYASL